VTKGERPARRSAGQLENEVLAALWAADTPMTPAEVLAAIGTDLAYNTVHTILTRLVEKGQVTRVSHAGRSSYAPARDATDTVADRMREILDSGLDRREVLARFASTLDAEEEAAVRAALRRGRRR
jgi:predicted transcriptional regulator